MKFQVDIPDDVFWSVAGRAETYDMKVHEYAAELVIAAAGSRAPIDSDPIVTLWREGYTDREIARRLDQTNAHVSQHRRRFKLPANRRSKENK